MTSMGWDGGIQLATGNVWEITCPKNIEFVFPGLLELLPNGTMLHFQDVLGAEVAKFLKSVEVEPEINISKGTVWPKRLAYHVRLVPDLVNVLRELETRHCSVEICGHLIAYVGHQVVMSWYDAWLDPLLVVSNIPETSVNQFCQAVGSSYSLVEYEE